MSQNQDTAADDDDDIGQGWVDGTTDVRQTPEFSRAAAVAIASPYFRGDDSLTGDAMVADWETKNRKREDFREAIEAAATYDDLPPAAQAEWELAMEAIDAENDTTLAERMGGEIGIGQLVDLPPDYEPLPLPDVADDEGEETTDDQG